MTYTEDENIGRIQISEHVVAVIAGIAATEVDGVDSLRGNISREIVAKLGWGSLTRGVKIFVNEDSVFADISVIIKPGAQIPAVCKNIQEKVSQAIETMTGLYTSEVNVSIADIAL